MPFSLHHCGVLTSWRRAVWQDRIEPLVRWCNTHFPGISTKEVVPWAGLRPMMPTMLPRVGSGAQAGVFYNTGHGHLGWTLSAATAEMVAEAAEQARRCRRDAAEICAEIVHRRKMHSPRRDGISTIAA